MHWMGAEPPEPHAIARDVAAQLVRAFAAAGDLLEKQEIPRLPDPESTAAELETQITARLELMVRAYGIDDMMLLADLLAEAIDNLGCGEQLRPAEVPAFRGPITPERLFADPPVLSDDVEQQRAELLRRGIVALGEERGDDTPVLLASAPTRELGQLALTELLPGTTLHWLGPAPREIMPTPCAGWSAYGDDGLRVWVRLGPGEHVDEIVTAEDDAQVAILALVCTAANGVDGQYVDERFKIVLDRPLGKRRIVDGFTGRAVAPA